MKIGIYAIDKKGKKELYDPLIEHYTRLCRPWARVELHELFPKGVARAQEQSAQMARASYTDALAPHLSGAYTIALDPGGETVDSEGFAALLKDRARIHFFIGGAYGFEPRFLEQCDKRISFGRITLSHKLVKVVLMEQIYRGLSILHGHPYHK
ncbi:23S rRNA (pseudouridine(1915)-N(3))-methyltransferase RlmH [Nitratifractor sp.]